MKPIIFNTEMVRAILDGRKTMTRRIVKTTPCQKKYVLATWDRVPTDREWNEMAGIARQVDLTQNNYENCPYPVGTRLWVRENWCLHARYNFQKPRELSERVYLQNGVTYLADVYKGEKSSWMGKTRPSIHMPRWASRITFEVTNVRVERLMKISEEDAKAEGVKSFSPYWVSSFANLWDSINGKKYPWKSNPWVFVIEFSRIITAP